MSPRVTDVQAHRGAPTDRPDASADGSAVPRTLRLGADHETARAVVLRFARAVIDRDAVLGTELLAERLSAARPSSRQRMSRQQFWERAVDALARIGVVPGTPLERVIDPTRLEARSARRHFAAEGLPAGLLPGDVVVRVPALEPNARWPAWTTLVVRVEPPARIVAVY